MPFFILMDNNNGVNEINVIDNISNNQQLSLSSIASKIEYCRLETDKKCLVTPYMSIYCTKDHVVSIGTERPMHAVCYVFDRKTGNFIRQISGKGNGPDDYLEVLNGFWDEKKELICVWSPPNYVFYKIDGTISHKINRTNNPYFSQSAIAFDDYYVRYVPNSTGSQTKRIVFFDTAGTLLDSIPNYRTWKMTKQGYTGGYFCNIHIFRNELYYIDMFCDTLYQIVDFKLHPRYVFKTKGHTLPYEVQGGEGRYGDLLAPLKGKELEDMWKNYFLIDKILEDAKYLYFTFDYNTKRYPSIYNKNEGVLQIMPPISIPLPSRNRIFPLYGFDNDLDGGLPFWPKQMISEKEMMCVYTAEELLELDRSKITDEKLKNVLNSIEIESNPVVAIVTLKD